MDNNDLLRRLRYALRCDDAQTAKLVTSGGVRATTAQAAGWRAKESEEQFTLCSAETVSAFLDGLILDKRGPRETPATSPWPVRSKDAAEDRSKKMQNEQADAQSNSTPIERAGESGADKLAQMDNNMVLKQLRIALSLRSDDVHAVLKAGGSAMSVSEASALFRKPDARNYRQCGDQVLRQFIAGLVEQRKQQDKE